MSIISSPTAPAATTTASAKKDSGLVPGQTKYHSPVTCPPRGKAFRPTPEPSPRSSLSTDPSTASSGIAQNEGSGRSSSRGSLTDLSDLPSSGSLVGLGISMVSIAEATAPPPLALPTSFGTSSASVNAATTAAATTTQSNPNTNPYLDTNSIAHHSTSSSLVCSCIPDAELALAFVPTTSDSTSSSSLTSASIPRSSESSASMLDSLFPLPKPPQRSKKVSIPENSKREEEGTVADEEVVESDIRWSLEAFNVSTVPTQTVEPFIFGQSLPFAIEEEPEESEEPETSESMYSTSSAPRSNPPKSIFSSQSTRDASSSNAVLKPIPESEEDPEKAKTFRSRIKRMLSGSRGNFKGGKRVHV
ncbi:hypothetical protein D9613_009806 [Agrocybe pediades]|uniref:Uncharacterized protein n=1 Tax=Agrocybe pediades TaxID=84607 RepID=A0A8H4QWN7_9AGAR|nr:hypothetical protein D9613_009806 [Agrocybe pediades]